MGSFAATHFTFHQGFDSVGNRTELRAVHGTGNDFKNTYTYDKLRRLTEVSQTSQPGGNAVLPKRVALEYNALGQRTKISRFESIRTTNAVATTDFTYDFANRLSSIAHKKGTTNLNTHSYTYDPLSRLRSITSTLDGTINYTYDQRSQLTIADDGQPYSPGHPTRLGERYQYDANGNREGTGFTVLADNDNRITAAPGETYTYDNEGNVISMITSIGVGSKSFQWDHRNRLTQSTVNTSSGIVTVNYAYDPFNRLVKRTEGFNTTYFGYDEGINPQLQMDTQSSNQITHRYLWSDQVDELFADEQRLSGLVPDTKWALSDHQGTIKDIADFNSSTGQTSVRHRAYDSFGNRKGSALPTDIVFGYTGKYFDEATGMQNSWNRWYSPKMGRFISQDPIGLRPDVNMYRYVGNSPTNFTDPSGLEPPGGTGPSTPGVPSPPNPIPHNPAGNPHSGPTSGNGTVQNEGKAAHRDFGKGTKLPNGQITDRLQDKPNKVIVNELKPDTRLQNNSKLKLAEEQLKKQMAGAQQLQPNKTVCGRLWGWTKDAGGKVKYVVVSRWEYVAEKKGGKWIAKKIPGVGIVVGLWGWGSDVQAKGAVCGTANSGLDMIPFVGLGKGVIEVIYGDDIIPDVETKNE